MSAVAQVPEDPVQYPFLENGEPELATISESHGSAVSQSGVK
jgi:hypothetical protein